MLNSASEREIGVPRPEVSSLPSRLCTLLPKGSKVSMCRVSILGIFIMIWESIPHNSTLDRLG